VPRLISEITEIVTGLGMLGFETLDQAIESRPAELIDVDDDVWARLATAWRDRVHETDFLAAFTNGRVFLRAADALRGRPPARIEWRGPHQSVGDEAVPADLRVDHVYLVSCKYLSKVLWNVSPANLFDRGLATGTPTRFDGDWFAAVAASEHQHLYDVVCRHHGGELDLTMRARDLSTEQRGALRAAIPRQWHPECVVAYRALCKAVSAASAERWSTRLTGSAERRTMLQRLLRIGSASYFVLGSGSGRALRLRVGSPWDWNRAFELRSFEWVGDGEGQPRVSWQAEVRDRATRTAQTVAGHVEVRWSHGRFNLPPEAKVYLDTPHHLVPGYWPLA
jgi:hypothetical protein